MVPPNNAPCISDLNLNTASPLGSTTYLPEVLRPATLDSPQFAAEMGSPKKRKPEMQNKDKNTKRIKKSKKDTQMAIQMEIEEVKALEKETKELEDEEMALKKRLKEMRDTYMDFIKNGQIVFVDNPTSTSSTVSTSSKLEETSPVANFSQTTVQYQTIGQITPGFVTPPSSSQDVVYDSMSENSSIYGQNVGYSTDPSSPSVQYLQLPVIQCTSQQWAAPPTPEDDVSMSRQPGPFLAEFTSNDIQSLPISWQEDLVTVDLDSINSIVILPFEDITQT